LPFYRGGGLKAPSWCVHTGRGRLFVDAAQRYAQTSLGVNS